MKAQAHNIIEAKNICKKFTTYKRKSLLKREKIIKEVVKNINFEIKEGEIVGFLGPNGAGKSTTIKMLTGILTPNSGECFVDNKEVIKHRKEISYNIGVVFGQKTQLWWDLSVFDNLLLLKEIYSLSKEDFNKRYEYLNEILDLEEIKHTQIRSLSLGQRMKADLASSLLHSPKILFLDETTIGLDVVIKDKILKTLKKINKEENVTILLTTHDMKDIEYLCERVIIINYGEIIYDNSLKKLKEYYNKTKNILISLKKYENITPFLDELLNDNLILSYKLDKNILTLTINNNIKFEKDVLIKIFQELEIEEIKFKELEIDKIIKIIYEK